MYLSKKTFRNSLFPRGGVTLVRTCFVPSLLDKGSKVRAVTGRQSPYMYLRKQRAKIKSLWSRDLQQDFTKWIFSCVLFVQICPLLALTITNFLLSCSWHTSAFNSRQQDRAKDSLVLQIGPEQTDITSTVVLRGHHDSALVEQGWNYLWKVPWVRGYSSLHGKAQLRIHSQ